MSSGSIPRVLIAAVSSGSGKTTVVSALLAALRARGLNVCAFKVGPDYIDPGYHAAAAGRPVYNLDTWLMSKSEALYLFADRSEGADIAIIEGVMGFYDGGRGGVSSTAEIASLLDAPVLLVMDVKSMGESAAAIAKGFREYGGPSCIDGVILNKLGSDSHRDLIESAMRDISMPVYGAFKRDGRFVIPERQLGLTPAEEDIRVLLTVLSNAAEESADVEAIVSLAKCAPDMDIPERKRPASGSRVRIAVAKDEAFSFYYPDSLAVLEEYGAELCFFSPLNDGLLPDCDGAIFGGGFPELFAKELSENNSMKNSISEAAGRGMPIYAECGGFMYLTRKVVITSGEKFAMAGIVPYSCRMNDKLQRVGYVEGKSLSDNVLAAAGSVMKGHEFHFSSAYADSPALRPAFRFTKQRNGELYEGGYASKNVLASYMHVHFAGNRQAARRFTDFCRRYAHNG